MKPILTKDGSVKSVEREESCLFIFIMWSVIMQMLSSQSTKINLHFICSAYQQISSAGLAGNSMYKISVKIPL